MHYEILDRFRTAMLPGLKTFKPHFYLAGGTALALHLGHRKSRGFDFFALERFDENALQAELKTVFGGRQLELLERRPQTVEILVDGVKISFFHFPYRLWRKPLTDKNFLLASVLDIACMKLNAVVGRSTNKDFADLYYILQTVSLKELLVACRRKMPELGENLVLKSLVYFKDIQHEPLKFMPGKAVAWKKIEAFMVAAVRELSN